MICVFAFLLDHEPAYLATSGLDGRVGPDGHSDRRRRSSQRQRLAGPEQIHRSSHPAQGFRAPAAQGAPIPRACLRSTASPACCKSAGMHLPVAEMARACPSLARPIQPQEHIDAVVHSLRVTCTYSGVQRVQELPVIYSEAVMNASRQKCTLSACPGSTRVLIRTLPHTEILLGSNGIARWDSVSYGIQHHSLLN